MISLEAFDFDPAEHRGPASTQRFDQIHWRSHFAVKATLIHVPMSTGSHDEVLELDHTQIFLCKPLSV